MKTTIGFYLKPIREFDCHAIVINNISYHQCCRYGNMIGNIENWSDIPLCNQHSTASNVYESRKI